MTARNPDFAVDYNLFVDGIGLLGLTKSAELAEWEQTIETWVAGGMAGEMPVDMYVIKQAIYKFVMAELNKNMVSTFGKTIGQEVTFKLRVATKGKNFGKLSHQFKGAVTKFNPGKLERGKVTDYEFEVTPVESTIYQNDEELIHVNMMSGEFRVNGVDMRSEINDAIGA